MNEFFLSYNHKDRNLATTIKYELELNGATAFLAHEDIEVSAEWRTEILNHLDSCAALLAIVTPRFHESVWVNQEVGFAMGKGKEVVPIIFEGRLPAFLESIQGTHATPGNISDVIRELLKSPPTGRASKKTSPTYEELTSLLVKVARHNERVGYLILFFIVTAMIVIFGTPVLGSGIVYIFTPGWAIGGALFKSMISARRELSRATKIRGPQMH